MRGNISRRGKQSWRLKFDVETDPVTGERQTRFVTVRGKRQDAERELTRLLTATDAGTLVEPSRITVAEALRTWLGNAHSLAGKTAERYQQLAEQQIIPHLGAIALQKLRPAQIADWHQRLLAAGGKDGRPLSSSTVTQAHRVLHRLLALALKGETVARNVASVITPPKIEAEEIGCLAADQIGLVLAALANHWLYPIVALALASGSRRGELLALRWNDIDLSGATLRVERSLEETKNGLRFKVPKTKYGRRTITLPPNAIETLRAHRRRQLELRMALGLGKPDTDALVFCTPDGAPMAPSRVSGAWRDVVAAKKLPRVSFHSLRHAHASALIARGTDVVTVSRRLGHGSPVVTLSVYSHIFEKGDGGAAAAIEAAMQTDKER
jgi:integrase